MFTGIVTGLGTVRAIEPSGAGRDMRLTIGSPWPETASIPLGASISCSGCCLTAIALGPDWFAVNASDETLSKTTLGAWRVGTRVNLERPLKVGDELGVTVVFPRFGLCTDNAAMIVRAGWSRLAAGADDGFALQATADLPFGAPWVG